MKVFMKRMEKFNESRELMEARPHPLIAVFIYTLLALLLIALVWSCSSTVDDFIRVNGVVQQGTGGCKVQLYVPEQYAGAVKPGAGVKYRFPGEHAELAGTVIGADTGTKIYPENGRGFYVIEASIGGSALAVKGGAVCEARIIKGTRKTLFYLLGKLGFMKE